MEQILQGINRLVDDARNTIRQMAVTLSIELTRRPEDGNPDPFAMRDASGAIRRDSESLIALEELQQQFAEDGETGMTAMDILGNAMEAIAEDITGDTDRHVRELVTDLITKTKPEA